MRLGEEMHTGACQHHPAEEILLGYAAGSLNEAAALIVATHLTYCPRCRAQGMSRVAEAVGGARCWKQSSPCRCDRAPTPSLDKRPRAQSQRHSHDRRCGVAAACFGPVFAERRGRAEMAVVGTGHHVMPMMSSTDDTGAKVGFMKIGAETSVPHHGHTDTELTMVLRGGLHRRRAALFSRRRPMRR